MVMLVLMSLSIVNAVAPGPPPNLTAHVTGNVVTLFWQRSSSGGVATGYRVEAALAPAGPPIAALAVTEPTIVVRDVPNGVYYVRVRALNNDGPSEPSNEVVVVVPGGSGGCSSPPPAPTNLSGSVSGNLVALAWSASAGGCAATGYTVQAGSAAGLSDLAVVNAGSRTELDASAPPGVYHIRVIALNAFGGSQASNEIVLTVASSCQTPARPNLLQPTVAGNIVSINWTSSDKSVTGYILEAGSASGATDLLNMMTTATSFTGTAPPGVAFVRVRALNACGTGPVSNEMVVTVPAQ